MCLHLEAPSFLLTFLQSLLLFFVLLNFPLVILQLFLVPLDGGTENQDIQRSSSYRSTLYTVPLSPEVCHQHLHKMAVNFTGPSGADVNPAHRLRWQYTRSVCWQNKIHVPLSPGKIRIVGVISPIKHIFEKLFLSMVGRGKDILHPVNSNFVQPNAHWKRFRLLLV